MEFKVKLNLASVMKLVDMLGLKPSPQGFRFESELRHYSNTYGVK